MRGSIRRFDTSDSLYAKSRIAEWLMRLSDYGAPLEDEFFSCLQWCTPLKPMMRVMVEIIDKEPEGGVSAAARETLQDMIKEYESHAARNLNELLEKYPCLAVSAREAIRRQCRIVAHNRGEGRAIYAQRRTRLKNILGLSRKAVALCEFIFIEHSFNAAERYFECVIGILKSGYRELLAAAFGIDRLDLQKAFSELLSCGLLEEGGPESLYVSDDIFRFMRDMDVSGLFYQPVSGKVLPLSSFSVQEGGLAHVESLLKTYGDDPVHILFYGPPGTGKTTCARSLAHALNIKAWVVPYRGDSENCRGNWRRTALMACMQMAAKQPGAFVLLDEADRFLDTGDRFGRETIDKAWLNDLLERPGGRIIWIVNDSEHLDSSVLRRFTFSVHFDRLRFAERRKIWSDILDGNKLRSRVSDAQLDCWTREYDVPASVIENAVRQAKKIGGGKHAFAQTTDRALKSYVTLIHHGNGKTIQSDGLGKFTPEGLCLDGSIPELLDKLCRVSQIQGKGGELPTGCATMLFYGPPGTGKSALAKYLANELDRKLIVKRASDLLDPYVGISERNVANAFKTAEREEGFLLIDEADSLIYSRETAIRSWESTLVNEFLTALEEYRGFCVCTTNRPQSVDAAALRRFSFKISFGYAKPAQVEALYRSLLAPLAKGILSDSLKAKLLSLEKLAPGDFNAVRSRFWLTEPKKVSHEELISGLAAEQRAKDEHDGRVIGFYSGLEPIHQ
jgi:AAA+ superfamily predicted ATPase